MIATKSIIDIPTLAINARQAVLDVLLSSDEFGRNQILSLFEAAGLSVVRAMYMGLLLFGVAGALAILVELGGNRFTKALTQVVVDALESVPIYLWVLAGVSAMPESRYAITTVIFVVAGLPLIFNAISGFVLQIMHEPFFLGSIALGANKWHLARYHIIPNLLPHAFPLVFYVVGAALAIYGGVGVFGFVNRSALDLGVFILRGKEQVGFDPTVLVLAVLAYSIIFFFLQVAIRRSRRDAFKIGIS